ncbi:hypothetical protein ACFOY4_38430 [Actinomadura syzygii]|uniref:Uncharacterized protein n=1 Tax=Actinomadura syzygii TaxID=1427538 RepID=A0A5D0U850_9ACTN|nr:hypothetical protein [Actinomadura syzygii]TYC14267.1 hypothetical protein FXF65_15445 [Actinomadura syzygii]
MFAVERDYSRTALQAISPEGEPLFIIERPDREVEESVAPIVYMANGKRVGRIHSDPLLDGRGIDRWRVMQDRWQLCDADGSLHCSAEQRVHPGLFKAPSESKKVDYANPAGMRIAHFNGRWLDVEFPLPDPLQLLVIASPIAFDLLDGA